MSDQIRTDTRIESFFPIPVYLCTRKSELELSEKKDIEDTIQEGMVNNKFNSYSKDSYIFDTRLPKIKEFCEKHIDEYVEKIYNPVENISCYITQSWLNVTQPNESHHTHFHPNSLISGVFYIQTLENDSIWFSDPNVKLKSTPLIAPKGMNHFNSDGISFSVDDLDLVLFPSWIEHSVLPNMTDESRMSISFNTFVDGNLGSKDNLCELTLD